MPLNQAEALLLSGMREDPAYLLLMDKLQAVLDDLTNQLHDADATKTQTLLPYWRAMRTIYIELRTTPLNVLSWLDELKLEDSTQLTENKAATNQLNQFLAELQKGRTDEPEPLSIDQLYPRGQHVRSPGNII